MKFFSILLTALSCQIFVNGQSAEDSIKQTINGMFTAIKSSDADGLKTYFADGAIFQTIEMDKMNVAKVKTEELGGFRDFVKNSKPGDADEQISFEIVKVDGPLAIVWTPYKFYYKGSFSHCGVNSFQLVRGANGWKVQYLIDTRRQKNCF